MLHCSVEWKPISLYGIINSYYFNTQIEMPKNHKSNVQSVTRVAALINILAESPADCSLGDIAERANLPSSTAHRLLTSLIQVGYVQQNPDTTRYGLGNNLIRLGHLAIQKHDLIRTARPWLEQMAKQTGETVNLTSRFDNSAIQLDHVDSPNMLRVSYPAGERFPLHVSASGKIFLAFMPVAERDHILSQSRKTFTQATIVQKEQLEREIEIIRQRGYALDNAEREIGVRCVAAPIPDSRGDVNVAISVSGPSVRISVARLHDIASELVITAQAISEARKNPAILVPSSTR